ncbi:uncharacterized protein LAJ45_03519 [Morchella importuna]|uniref:Rhodopsin domain-containing protein n=1 Tax=Morchella conica CCBAS932 TaxID=1392247 RepID=A0A3N4KKF6_9PEZI|nr:uncharacterized protein LAJ45_03519 [Morchella importuna]KAH8152678.1 hypothetical protein LAJ45_03519 [Morchella importuna]RPB11010.1 hypothetical protein P167DRAFT_524864 [Morchella conica CCBAS932]
MLSQSNISSIVVTYVCTFLSAILIVTRLLFRFHRGERMYTDDTWMGISLAPLFIRLGIIHMVLVYGTNNIDFDKINVMGMSEEEMHRRVVGSKLILASRVFYAGFLWCMKVCILGFYERLTARSKPYGLLIDFTYLTCGITFIAVILGTVLECRPFPVYWQMSPYPGECVKAVAQLLTMATFNILTDAMLILIPLPMVFKSRLPLIRKIQLLVLFGLGFFVMAVTIVRLPVIIGDQSVQKARTLWASIECFVACVVANAPVLNSFIQKVRKHAATEHNQYQLNSSYARRRRMPVTGQDSVGSLTRNDEMISVIETRTEVVQKIDINLDESMSRSRSKKSPWRGDFLGTQIWTESETETENLYSYPPRVVLKTDRSGSV